MTRSDKMVYHCVYLATTYRHTHTCICTLLYRQREAFVVVLPPKTLIVFPSSSSPSKYFRFHFTVSALNIFSAAHTDFSYYQKARQELTQLGFLTIDFLCDQSKKPAALYDLFVGNSLSPYSLSLALLC